ncbi:MULTISPECIES: glycosyltransferase family 2 protein [unclassified Micromonospora]|uniref:glycosyltransferase family 2 protein n=1 Tax=unclassified Micromonospora TaxID=2617518 RepID=UPI0022B6E61D|nr:MULTISPECIES: glycosyltransferase family 2 protein [unclassified Micromonospora]MCZ7418623.1 glycosyltransferase family 2 protein [Verrucosispora sp. WMMA2121]WBB92329.1 glycosyltransferase family 2 protein [Verrucosispora sp. WMMC514]
MVELDATAIVVTYNSQGQVLAALTALRQAGLPVRLVDNGSTDRTVELVRTHFPEVTVLVGQGNVGFAAAVNRGASGVQTSVLLLVNPDCVVPPETTRALVETVFGRPEIGIAGPRLLDADGQVAVSAHPFETLTTVVASRFGGMLVPVPVRRWLSGRRRRQAYDACLHGALPARVDWVSGACLAVRADLFTAVGGLDEAYFMYYEDEELCLQVRCHGAEVLYLPHVTAVHSGGASSSDPAWIWPHLYRSMLVFFSRHRPRSRAAVRAVVLLRAVLGVILATVRLSLQPGAGITRMRAWTRVGRIAITRIHI